MIKGFLKGMFCWVLILRELIPDPEDEVEMEAAGFALGFTSLVVLILGLGFYFA